MLCFDDRARCCVSMIELDVVSMIELDVVSIKSNILCRAHVLHTVLSG